MNIVLLGSGGVAYSLAFALKDHLCALYNRTQANGLRLIEALGSTPKPILLTDVPARLPLDADLYIIAVPDDAIGSVAQALPPVHGTVVHTSAVAPLRLLAPHAHTGVLYPPNTFSKQAVRAFQGFTFLTESNGPTAEQAIARVCALLGAAPLSTLRPQRLAFHLAAVFACNFTNHLYLLAEEIMQQAIGGSPLTKELLDPLQQETLRKALLLGPLEAQTGPALRHDNSTLALHRTLLEKYPAEYLQLYNLLTQSIQSHHEPPAEPTL